MNNIKKEIKIRQAKDAFLWKYNPSQSVEIALSESIDAAVQRNTYKSKSEKANLKIIKSIRKQWKACLYQNAKIFTKNRSEDTYLESVELIKLSINEYCRNHNFESKIKISHAQKSLSVFLKHLWCFQTEKVPDEYTPQIYPPQCPVDSIILNKIGWRKQKWTTVDSIKEHMEMIEAIREYAKTTKEDLSLAEWELFEFL